MPACAFVIPGDIDLPTGGYAYDRRVLALLRGHGIDVHHVALPGTFPSPTQVDVMASAAALAALPRDTVLLFDGLAYGAMPTEAVWRIRQPIVALCHHPLALETGVSPARSAALKGLERAALAHARRVVVTSPATRLTLIEDFAVPSPKVIVAEPGTDPAPAARPWRTGPVRMLTVGSVIPRKGYEILVEALAGLQVPPESPDWTVRIAGSTTLAPETADALRRQIIGTSLDAQITLLGSVDAPRLDRLYAGTHLFLMPSLYEGYGMVLAEAMARGLPIISTTGGAAADLVPEGAGIKVAPGDVAAFRMALRQVLSDPSRLTDMAKRSRAAGQDLPRWDDTARIIASVIKEVAA